MERETGHVVKALGRPRAWILGGRGGRRESGLESPGIRNRGSRENGETISACLPRQATPI